MPVNFDRFRLLNGSGSIRNESTKKMYVKHSEEDPGIEVLPGTELPLPASEDLILDIERQEEPRP